jgi:hypothetical protein
MPATERNESHQVSVQLKAETAWMQPSDVRWGSAGDVAALVREVAGNQGEARFALAQPSRWSQRRLLPVAPVPGGAGLPPGDRA